MEDDPKIIDPIMDAAAGLLAHAAVRRFGRHLPEPKQRRLRRRYYDVAMNAQLTYRDMLDTREYVRSLALAAFLAGPPDADLERQVAASAVEFDWQELPGRKRAKVRARVYHRIYSSLLAYRELDRARRQRVQRHISGN